MFSVSKREAEFNLNSVTKKLAHRCLDSPETNM